MGMNGLPLDVSMNIFSRLHVDSVLDSKLVCKPLRDIIKDPSFAQKHLARRKLLLQNLDENCTQDLSANACDTVQSGFLLLDDIGRPINESRLHYVEYDVDAEKKSYKLKNKTINIPPMKNTTGPDSELVTVSSCNGLICSTMRHHQLNDPIHICNPITREYVYLPRYTSEEKIGADEMVSGFGYSPSTDEYKIVRIYHKRNGAWYFQVYVLGNESNKWTEEKEIPHPLFHNVCQHSKGVLLNGEIHWLDQASNVVAFSLADEEFHLIASPPLVEDSTVERLDSTVEKRLSVLGDWLCIVHHISGATRQLNRHFDIWLLKKNNDITVQQNGTSTWNKEFTVYPKTFSPWQNLFPLAFTKQGKVLFWQDCRFVSCYDPKTAILEKLSREGGFKDLSSYQAHSHINSFVSLKALGVKKCRRRLQYYGQVN